MNWKILLSLTLVLMLASAIRLYQLGNDPALYWEEVALGYDAYSVLKTGRDHHGNPWPLIAFESFGDWKPSLYFYMLIPSVATFGLTEWAVRLPSALAGVLTIGLVFGLVSELFITSPETSDKTKTRSVYLGIVSAFMVAIMPWHILVSRVGFETNLGLLLVVLGGWLWQKALHANLSRFSIFTYLYLFLSTLAFGLSLYAYHGNRVFTPLLVLGLGLGWVLTSIRRMGRSNIKKGLLTLGLFFTLFGVLALPILLNLRNPQIQQRFAETSAYTTLDPILKSNAAIEADGNNPWSRVLHHRFWYYTEITFQNYAKHWDPYFLMLAGDTNRRHSIGLAGQLLWLQLGLVLVGLFFFFKNREWRLWPVMVWLILAPVPASLTVASPHALRALAMVVPLAIFSGSGLYEIISVLKGSIKWGLIVGVMVILSVETIRFWHYYALFYPQTFASEWQVGYRELIQYIKDHQTEYDVISVTRELGRPAMYYWFYTQTDPHEVQAWNRIALKDQGEYLEFKHLSFGSKPKLVGKTLIVLAKPDESPKGRFVTTISSLGREVFWLYEE